MMTIKTFLSMAALALVGVVMSGCSSSDGDSITDTPQQPENKSKVVTLTTTVGFGGSAGTRALAADGTKTFAAGDKIAVIYKNTSGETIKAVSDEISSGAGTASATFTVTLTNPDNTKAIRYIYPAAMAKATIATGATIDDAGTVDFTNLDSQDGSLTTLGSNLDLCTLDAANWTSGTLPTGTLANQLAILACTLKNSDGSSNITGTITGMTVSDGTNSYAVTGHDSDGHIYVAIRPTAAAALEINASTGIVDYTKTATSREYAAGNGYNLSWRMAIGKTTPLTMEATSDGNIVVNKPKSGMQYRLNGGDKTPVTSEAITVQAGDKVQFYGNGKTITSYYGTYISGGSATVKVYGNIMSLVDEVGFATATELTATLAFAVLFEPSGTAPHDKLTDASGLLLPATTLTKQCYNGMFADCTNLTAAPELPAETLAENCYGSMFQGCTSLTTAPALPAETLANYCYKQMFQDCTSLTTAPELPAKTLKKNCYREMFYGCSNLNAVTCLATDKSASDCTYHWLSGVAATGTFTKAKGVQWSGGVSYVPSGWTVVDK